MTKQQSSFLFRARRWLDAIYREQLEGILARTKHFGIRLQHSRDLQKGGIIDCNESGESCLINKNMKQSTDGQMTLVFIFSLT